MWSSLQPRNHACIIFKCIFVNLFLKNISTLLTNTNLSSFFFLRMKISNFQVLSRVKLCKVIVLYLLPSLQLRNHACISSNACLWIYFEDISSLLVSNACLWIYFWVGSNFCIALTCRRNYNLKTILLSYWSIFFFVVLFSVFQIWY